MGRRGTNYASNPQITFFLTRSQLAELEALNPYKTTCIHFGNDKKQLNSGEYFG